SPLTFYPRYAWEILSKLARVLAVARAYRRIARRVAADPDAANYRDLALTPATAEEVGALEIFSATDSAKQAVAKEQRRKTHRPLDPTATGADIALSRSS